MQETKPVVAFLGPTASYTHQATLSKFPETKYEVQPKQSIEDVFAAVQLENSEYGIVPFENSSNGSVIFTLDLFADIYSKYPDILVEGEIYLPVHHCLVGHSATRSDSGKDLHLSKFDRPWRKIENLSINESPSVSGTVTPTQKMPDPGVARVKPAHDISHIMKLYSHPQAWGQCKLFLNTYLKGVERQDVSSTSKAAQLVSEDHSGTSAAISSKIAATMNNLTVLAEGIEDVEGNATRFFILRKRQSVSLPTTSHASIVAERNEMPKYKTLVSFTVKHDYAGSLADSLALFKKYDLNLTSMHSRPSGQGPWRYIFFVEFQGRKRKEGCGGAVNAALEELSAVADAWRFLGSWENELQG